MKRKRNAAVKQQPTTQRQRLAPHRNMNAEQQQQPTPPPAENNNGKNGKNGNGNGFSIEFPDDPFEMISRTQARRLLRFHAVEVDKAAEAIAARKEAELEEQIKKEKENGIHINYKYGYSRKKKRQPGRGGGRPSLYKGTDHCLAAIQCMSVGMGFGEMSCHLGVVGDTIKNWAKDKPEFLVAVQIGKKLYERWWKMMGRVHVATSPQRFNTNLYSLNMGNRFDWAKKEERSDTIKGKQTIEHKHKVEEIASNSSKEEQLGEVIRILVEAGVIPAEAQRASSTTLQ